jgi:hypothetical protein
MFRPGKYLLKHSGTRSANSHSFGYELVEKERSSIGGVMLQEIGALADTERGGNPIELLLLFNLDYNRGGAACTRTGRS